MAGENTVFELHEAGLRKLARDAQELIRISEHTCSTYLKTSKKLHEELSESDKRLAEANVQIKRLEAELVQVRGELTEDKRTLREKEVTIARLEATVLAQEKSIDHTHVVKQRDEIWEKYRVLEKDTLKAEEENKKMRTELELRRSDTVEPDHKRARTDAHVDTGVVDPEH